MYNKNIKKSKRKQKTSRFCDKNSIVGLLSKSDRKQIHQESHGKRIELSALVERRVEKDCRHNSFKYTAASFRQNMVTSLFLFPPLFYSIQLINIIDLKVWICFQSTDGSRCYSSSWRERSLLFGYHRLDR